MRFTGAKISLNEKRFWGYRHFKVIPLKCSTIKLFLKLGVMNIHDMNIIKMQ